VKTITIQANDDRYTIRETLRRIDDTQVLVTLPWDADQGWSLPMDYEVQLRVAQGRGLDMAWVVDDPQRRGIAKRAGLPVFRSETDARQHLDAHTSFPEAKPAVVPPRPGIPWWAPRPTRPKKPRLRRPPTWLLAAEGLLLIGVLLVVAVAAVMAVPSARIVIHPASATYTRIVQVSVDPDVTSVDLQQGVIPAERIGDEFEGYAEVVTSGRGYAVSGRASGTVLFTNLLGQNYQVPANTIVRTSAGSYPVRYTTTADTTVPAFGQATAPVEALVEGPRGNVDAYQINLVEGVAGFAVRVTNPEPIAGAESKTVRTVSEEDRDRAWDLAAQQVVGDAYNGLQVLATEQLGRFLPRQTLVVQSAPKVGYTHLTGEQTDVLGLSLRLLITGHAVEARDAQAVAYHQLVAQLPVGYTLTDARFEYGEAAEEEIGPGLFTFFLTAHGYATARVDANEVIELLAGTPIDEAAAKLSERFPLSGPPEITVSPSWFPYLPFVDLNTKVEIVPGRMSP